MKEDVLEQIVEDHLQLQGYFTRHNLRFRPSADAPGYESAKDSVSSDIDVVGFNPLREGPERVRVVSCKSWQTGLNPTYKLGQLQGTKKNGKRETWKSLREIWDPKWNRAFRDRIKEATGSDRFHYSIAVTKLTGKVNAETAAKTWMDDPTIAQNLDGCTFSFLTLEDMWSDLQASLTTTPASSEIGRLAQLLKAAGVQAK